MTTGHRIPLKGYRLDRRGQLVKDARKLDVSARIRQRGSKKVRVVRSKPKELHDE